MKITRTTLGELHIRAHRAWAFDGIDVAVMIEAGRPHPVRFIATSMTAEEYEPGRIMEPTARIDETAAQALMDDLWTCGIRPTEGTGSAGAMAAAQVHLEDMRKLTDRLLTRLLRDEPGKLVLAGKDGGS